MNCFPAIRFFQRVFKCSDCTDGIDSDREEPERIISVDSDDISENIQTDFPISPDHLDLELTGPSSFYSPEEFENLRKKIGTLQFCLHNETGIAEIEYDYNMKLIQPLIEVLVESVIAVEDFNQERMSLNLKKRTNRSVLNPKQADERIKKVIKYVQMKSADFSAKFKKDGAPDELSKFDQNSTESLKEAACAFYLHLFEIRKILPGAALRMAVKNLNETDELAENSKYLVFGDFLLRGLRSIGFIPNVPHIDPLTSMYDEYSLFQREPSYTKLSGHVRVQNGSYGQNPLDINIFELGSEYFESLEVFQSLLSRLPRHVKGVFDCKTGDVPVQFTDRQSTFLLIGIVAKKGEKMIYGGRSTFFRENENGQSQCGFINRNEKVYWQEWDDFEVMMTIYGEKFCDELFVDSDDSFSSDDSDDSSLSDDSSF